MAILLRQSTPRPHCQSELEASVGGHPDRFAIRISHGRCEVRSGGAPDAQAAATFGADDLVRLLSGGVGSPELLSSGSRERSGDPFLALRFPNLFRLPAARS